MATKAELEAENKALTEKVGELETELKTAGNTIDNINKTASDEIGELEASIETLNEANKGLTELTDKLKGEYNEIVNECLSLKTTIENLESPAETAVTSSYKKPSKAKKERCGTRCVTHAPNGSLDSTIQVIREGKFYRRGIEYKPLDYMVVE